MIISTYERAALQEIVEQLFNESSNEFRNIVKDNETHLEKYEDILERLDHKVAIKASELLAFDKELSEDFSSPTHLFINLAILKNALNQKAS